MCCHCAAPATVSASRHRWKLFSCNVAATPSPSWSRLERHEWGDVFDVLKRPRVVRGHGNRLLMVGGLKSSFALNAPCSTCLLYTSHRWKLFSCNVAATPSPSWSRLERHEWGDVFDVLKRPRLVRGHGNRILMVSGLKSSFALNAPCSTILVLRLDLDKLEWAFVWNLHDAPNADQFNRVVKKLLDGLRDTAASAVNGRKYTASPLHYPMALALYVSLPLETLKKPFMDA
ncbi:hypothetical protein DEO72_LG6g904 [Vigna unguiculata]|uniref:Uncharacterized protein n=1 Tax=Vigna unguiculata TaxID=3917 RepID=A0A4D6M4L6_VIGUN|nr:hypothetical protein DEO72_LG6g904 [Vigna unguiculata]